MSILNSDKNESIYYEITNLPNTTTTTTTTNDVSYLNQIIKLDDYVVRVDDIDDNDDDILNTNKINNSQKVLNNSYSEASTSNNVNNNIKQLSRNSSTFSSKSHYSMRSSMTKGTGGGGNGGCTASNNIGIGSINLSITTTGGGGGGQLFTNSNNNNNSKRNSKEQEIINEQQQQQQQNIIIMNTNPIIDRYSIKSSSSASSSIYSLNYTNYINIKDPVIIRGAGNITIFGVCNKFNEQFPTQLNAKLAPEEFRDTIKQINQILSKELANSFRWLVFGSVFCCCTLGISLLPVIFMNKKAKLSINKLLDIENQRLYLKLGLKWKLTKMKCNSNSLTEYVLLIEILPTVLLYQPD
jgi:hypothetical protein